MSISGFGTASGAAVPGCDFGGRALGGLRHITGEADGPPSKVGVAVVDVLCGEDAALGALAALVRRGVTGRGVLVHRSGERAPAVLRVLEGARTGGGPGGPGTTEG